MTGRRLLFAGVWILSLVGISFYGGPLSYGFFFGVTLLPVLSLVYLGMVVLFFRLYQKLESRNVVCGQLTDYYFVLQNDTPFAFPGVRILLFPDFFTVEEMPQDVEYELLPRDKFTFRTRLACKYRGEYEVGVKSVVFTDFLHLFRIKYQLPSTIRAIVAPRVVQVDALKSIEQLDTPRAREVLTGRDHPQAMVRDYIPGDSMRLLHWKATAKTGELKVRQYEGESKQGIYLYFMGKRYSKSPESYLPLENKLLETVLAVSFYFTCRDIEIHVKLPGEEGEPFERISGAKGFEQLYARLTDFSFASDYPERKRVDRFCRLAAGSPARVVFLVVHEVSRELLDGTKRLSDLGVYVVLYVISDEPDADLEGLVSERRRIVLIETGQDLTNVL